MSRLSLSKAALRALQDSASYNAGVCAAELTARIASNTYRRSVGLALLDLGDAIAGGDAAQIEARYDVVSRVFASGAE